MAKVENIEKIIRKIEGFDIRFMDKGPKRSIVEGSLSGIPQNYDFLRGAEDGLTVSEWKNTRFYPMFPAFDVDVLDKDGSPVNGHTKLGAVRNTYAAK